MSHRHMLVTIYSRPWWNWFRKTYSIRCWTCDIEVWEPQDTPKAQVLTTMS